MTQSSDLSIALRHRHSLPAVAAVALLFAMAPQIASAEWPPALPGHGASQDRVVPREPGPWIVVVTSADFGPSPATLLGVHPDELLRVDANDPARTETIEAAFERWEVQSVLVLTRSEAEGRLEQERLITAGAVLRHGLETRAVRLELITASDPAGSFMWHGPHPDQQDHLSAAVAPALLEENEVVEEEPRLAAQLLPAPITGPAVQATSTLSPAGPPMMAMTTAGTAGIDAASAGSGLGWLGMPLFGLTLAIGLVVWSNRETLRPTARRLRQRTLGRAKSPLELSSDGIELSNPRLGAALERLREKLRVWDRNRQAALSCLAAADEEGARGEHAVARLNQALDERVLCAQPDFARHAAADTATAVREVRARIDAAREVLRSDEWQ